MTSKLPASRAEARTANTQTKAPAILTASGLTQDYTAASTAPAGAIAPHTLALDHVDLTIRQGETIAVMGPSGSGKTTLLHTLAGITAPTAGTVVFQGRDLASMSDAERTRLRRGAFGFVFQSGQLLPELPAVENIALPLMLAGTRYREATDTAILWLERLGLRHLAGQRPGEMSGGQMQRIAIARALAIRPAIIFADEPTGALDQTTGRDVMAILTQTARETDAALVVVTHDPNVAAYCSRTIVIRDGRIEHTADADAARPADPFTAEPADPGRGWIGGAR